MTTGELSCRVIVRLGGPERRVSDVSWKLLHLSDLHLKDRGAAGEGEADRSLARVLDACSHLSIAAVVVTGDIADDGSVAAYQRARDVLGAFARDREAFLMFAPGNHDRRGAFARVLGSGHFDPAGADCGEPGPDDLRCASTVLAGLRVVTLDSLVPGKWYGRLGDRQLDWLQELLRRDPSLPTVLGLHHPPITLDVEIQRRVRLEDRAALADVLRDSPVAAVLSGHFHQQIAGSLAGVPVWVTAGVVSRIDHLTGPAGLETALVGGSATLVDLTDQTSPLFATITAQDPGLGTEAYRVTFDELADDLSAYGLHR